MCGCGGSRCGGGLNTPPGEKSRREKLGEADEEEDDEDEEDTDDGDEWLKGITPCSRTDVSPSHCHAKMATDDKGSKRRFHF